MSKFIVYTVKPHTYYKEAVLALENVCTGHSGQRSVSLSSQCGLSSCNQDWHYVIPKIEVRSPDESFARGPDGWISD